MDRGSFSEITSLSESFCERCFNYDNKDDIKLINTLQLMVAKINANNNKDLCELLYVFVERGARTAFLKYALPKTQRGEKATEGITSDSEFKLILSDLRSKYPKNEDLDVVDDIFKHLLLEIG